MIGGAGALSVTGEGSNMIIVGGAGPAFLSPGRGYALVFQGVGEININGGSGPLQMVAGRGDTNIAAGSGGVTLDIVKGAAGGLDVIGGFVPSRDHLDLFGFTASDLHSHVQNGSATISMSDGSRVTLLGISDPGRALSLI